MSYSASTLVCTAAALALFSATRASAGTLDDNMVVRGNNDSIVHALANGTCVRTKWEAGTDVCAPVVAQQVVQVPPAPVVKRTVLSTSEKTVYFDFDSASLSASEQEKLSSVAATLKSAKDVQSADIVGYADRIGTTSYNENLSRRRANNVKDYLANQGYLNTNVAAVRGVGESGSVTNCDTSLPREQQINCLSPDRRVEVEIRYFDTEHYYQSR